MKHLYANTLLQLHIHCDIVSYINILAKMFQARDMDPEKLNRAIDSSIGTLKKMYLGGGGTDKAIKWGPKMANLLGKLKEGDTVDGITEDKPSELVLGVHRLEVTAEIMANAYIFAEQLALSTIRNLERRFPDKKLVGAFLSSAAASKSGGVGLFGSGRTVTSGESVSLGIMGASGIGGKLRDPARASAHSWPQNPRRLSTIR